MNIQKVNLEERFEQFSDTWNPRIVGELNGQLVKLLRCKGPFIWHRHHYEDELFYVIKGVFTIKFRDHVVRLRPGEMLIVPKGVEHCPDAESEVVWVMVFERGGALKPCIITNETAMEESDH